MNNTLKGLQDKIEDLNKEIQSKFNEALKEAAASIFNKYLKLESFNWIQYTPYFNDGEPCEFSINGEAGYKYGDFECHPYDTAISGTWSPTEHKYVNTKLCEEAEPEFESVEMAEALQDELNDFVQALYPFENHVKALLGEGKIIVTREGITTEDYDHD